MRRTRKARLNLLGEGGADFEAVHSKASYPKAGHPKAGQSTARRSQAGHSTLKSPAGKLGAAPRGGFAAIHLALRPPFPPMEALAAEELPAGPGWQYEPKWDGFRCIAFREKSTVELQSKAGQPLTRYFPELVTALGELKTGQFVLDGEVVIPIGGDLSFDDLLMRIHPAESRVRKLASETPSLYLVFDLLLEERGGRLTEKPLRTRRKALEQFARKCFGHGGRVRLSPYTCELKQARRWFLMNAGLDGIIAKREDAAYESGQRSGAMQKIKRWRTAECVVGGFRYAEKRAVIGSLLLGLYDQKGLLHHVGFTSSIREADKEKLTKKLAAMIQPPGFTGRAPGGLSRWSTRRSMEWQPLESILVVEVQFDHFSGGRFRHGTRLLRWRPDKAPRQCTMEQVKQESRSPLTLL